MTEFRNRRGPVIVEGFYADWWQGERTIKACRYEVGCYEMKSAKTGRWIKTYTVRHEDRLGGYGVRTLRVGFLEAGGYRRAERPRWLSKAVPETLAALARR